MSTESAVLNLLQQQNKPFSLQNLVDLLAHAGHKKAAINKALDTLVESGKIIAKEFGKTKIFVPQQGNLQVLSKEEHDGKKAIIKTLTDELQKEKEGVKALEQEMSTLRSCLTEAEIKAETQQLDAKLADLDTKLKALSSGAVLISPEERVAVEKVFSTNMEHWRKRKAMFKNIWGSIAESFEGKKDSEYFEEIGVDTDEMVGVDYRALEALLPSANKRRKF